MPRGCARSTRLAALSTIAPSGTWLSGRRWRATTARCVLTTCVLCVALACGSRSSPVSPSPGGGGPPDPGTLPGAYDGAWEGQYRLVGCTGDRACPSQLGTTPPFTLRLDQIGGAVSGLFATAAFLTPVSGSVDPTGGLTLTGSIEAASPDDYTGSVTVRFLALRRSVDGGLAGTLLYEMRPTHVTSGRILVTHEAVIESGMQADQSSDPATFDGTWRGWFVVRACTPIRWLFCYWREPDSMIDLEATLTEAGGSVTGTMIFDHKTDRPVTVSGRVTDGELSLEGFGSVATGGGHDVIRLTRWTSRRDALGQMSGRFNCSDEYHIEAGVDAGHVNLQIYEAELAGFSLGAPVPGPRVVSVQNPGVSATWSGSGSTVFRGWPLLGVR